jgi:hypothetical protein
MYETKLGIKHAVLYAYVSLLSPNATRLRQGDIAVSNQSSLGQIGGQGKYIVAPLKRLRQINADAEVSYTCK